MILVHPEALLLAIPLAVGWWAATRPAAPPPAAGRGFAARIGAAFVARLRRPGAVLRLVLLALALLLVAHPVIVSGEPGSDLIVVVDRSRSMNAAARQAADEIIRIVEDGRGEGDRVGVVAFGGGARVERLPDAEARFEGFEQPLDADASDLAEGLEAALGILDAERPSRILVIGDGESTGPSPVAAASRAAARGVPIDHHPTIARREARDVAVRALDLPPLLAPGESFRFFATVVATAPGETGWTLMRGDEVIAQGRSALRIGENRLVFRDRAPAPGGLRYRLVLQPGDDAVPENDVGLGVTRVEGEGAVLLVTPDGRPGALGRALEAFGRPVDVVAVDAFPARLGELETYRAAVFENVRALDLDRARLEILARWVRDGGGGLMITGGRRSFALGGWQKTAVEPLLPVSLEPRNRHRKLSVGIAFVLDRSGSMGAQVTGGMTKMQLANLATLAGLEQLGAQDEVAVIPVDTAPQLAVPLQALVERERIERSVRDISPGGGGILVEVALDAAARELRRSNLDTRHILLFADAADATQPGEYEITVPRLVEEGIRVSVIALGRETDPHADLLREIAALGDGDIHFSDDPAMLPQVFSAKTVAIAGASFVTDTTAVGVEPGLLVLGDVAATAPPPLGGYNLTFLREGATLGLSARDEEGAPVLAFWQRGVGRVAAFTGEADGEHTGAFGDWEGYGAFFASLGDWLSGPEERGELLAVAGREGRTVRVTLMVDPERPESLPKGPVELVILPEDAARPSQTVPMRRESESEFQAVYRLDDGDVRHHRVLVDGRMLRANPVTLPYSPEFESRHGRPPGEDLLAEVSLISGGVRRIAMDAVFAPPRSARTYRSLAPHLALALLLLALAEIAWRRLALGEGRLGDWSRGASRAAARSPEPPRPADPAPPVTAAAPDPQAEAAARAARRRSAEDLLAEAKRRSRR